MRVELVSLYRQATCFDEKHKALALMEKVGGFVPRVKGETSLPDGQADPAAIRVQRMLNGRGAD